MNKKPYKATYYAVLRFKNKRVKRIRTTLKNRILFFAKEDFLESGYIKFNYGHGEYNEGEFENIKELKRLICVFSEMELYAR